MQNRFSLIYDPVTTWQKLADKNYSVSQIYIRMLLVMAAIPPISAFIGSSYIGWRIGFEEPVKLTVESAAVLCICVLCSHPGWHVYFCSFSDLDGTNL